jgi:hypothetical protein
MEGIEYQEFQAIRSGQQRAGHRHRRRVEMFNEARMYGKDRLQAVIGPPRPPSAEIAAGR